jgi:hypothetical protein
MYQYGTVRMFVRKELFAKLISRIVSLKYPFVTGLVLNHGQVWFMVPVFLATFKIKED